MNRFMLLAGLVFVGMAHAAAPVPAAAPAPAPAPPGYELTLVDMQGQKKVLGTLPPSVFAPRISPDGRRVAFELADPPAPNTPEFIRPYVAELDKLDKRRALQATLTAPRNYAPVWSADGDWIVFLASGNGGDALFIQRSDGYIQPKYLVDGRAPEGMSKDGVLTFITLTGNRDYGISQLDLTTGKVTRLIDQPGTEQHSSRISPDGRWIAYVSNETGRQEVWLEPLPLTGKRFQLTKKGGSHPLWSPDGSKIYFDQDRKMFRLDMTMGEEPKARDPVVLPISGFQQGNARRQYDITPDGKSFVMLFPSAAAPPAPPAAK